MADFRPIQCSPIDKTTRGITPETFGHWRYQYGELDDGTRVHVANHYVDRMHTGQKTRDAGKNFKVLGKMDALYGRWLWPGRGRRVVVTEGELDALSVSQAQGNKWPVVSVPNGAQGAVKACRDAIDWLLAFDEVVILFDDDEPGRKAAVEVAKLLPVGKAKIATLPRKDANEMLKAGEEAELVSAIWNAAPYRPDGVVTLKDIRDKALRPIEVGRPWVFPTLTKATFGRRPGELYFLGAGTGVGKTDVLTECIAFDINELGLKVGCVFLEQDVSETGKRLAGKIGNKRFHVPDGTWTQDELTQSFDSLADHDSLFLYDNFGSAEWDHIKVHVEYLATSCGCQHIYIDHLTALASHAEDERKELERICAEMAMLAKRLGVTLHVVSHLATPDGKSHEEGGRVTIRHFKGSRAIGFWAHFMFGLERDQQADDETMRHVTTFRVLKDRYTGQATGLTFYLKYDFATGRVREGEMPTPGDSFPSSDKDVGF